MSTAGEMSTVGGTITDETGPADMIERRNETRTGIMTGALNGRGCMRGTGTVTGTGITDTGTGRVIRIEGTAGQRNTGVRSGERTTALEMFVRSASGR
jgi:hypothetical protein